MPACTLQEQEEEGSVILHKQFQNYYYYYYYYYYYVLFIKIGQKLQMKYITLQYLPDLPYRYIKILDKNFY
ncbi:MAG: hypothetical protein K0Q82_642 [Chryseobacterium indoltheticum]|jgi:hypothetical protein|nr:hypothetical protein [Chryseobacterium indoltheticum]